MKVILLNNNPAVSKLISVSLNKLGYEFVQIDDLETLASNNADLIICDSGLYNSEVNYLDYAQNQLFLIPRNKNDEYNIDQNEILQKPFLPTDFIDIVKKILKDDSDKDIEPQQVEPTIADKEIKIGNEFGEIQDIDNMEFKSNNETLSDFDDLDSSELLDQIDDMEDQFVENEFDEFDDTDLSFAEDIDELKESDQIEQNEEKPLLEQFGELEEISEEINQTEQVDQNNDLILIDDEDQEAKFDNLQAINEHENDTTQDDNLATELEEIIDETTKIQEEPALEQKQQDIKDITNEYQNIELDISTFDELLDGDEEPSKPEPIVDTQEVLESTQAKDLDYTDNLNELSSMLDEIDNMDYEEESVSEITNESSKIASLNSCYEASTIDELDEAAIKEALHEDTTQIQALNTDLSIEPNADDSADISKDADKNADKDELAQILAAQIGQEIGKALSNSSLKDMLKDLNINVSISFEGK